MTLNRQTAAPAPSPGNEPRRFINDIIWIGLSQIFTSLLGIVSLPALTKSYSTEMYGVWAQVMVTVNLIIPLVTLYLGNAAIRFLSAEEDPLKRRQYLGSMLTAIIISAGVILIIVNLLASQFSLFLFDSPRYIIFVRLTAVWVFISGLYVFLVQYLRSRRQIKRLSIMLTAYSAVKILTIVALAKTGFSLEWVIGALIGVDTALFGVLFYIVVRGVGFPTPNFKNLRGFLAFSIPQIPSGILLWIIAFSDRYFITHFLDLSQTGVYSSSNVLGGIISLCFSPINYVLYPAVSRAWEEKRLSEVKNYFEYSNKLFLTLAIPAAAGVAILSQPLLQVLATSQYLAGWQLVLLVAVGTIFLGIYQNNAFIILLIKKTQWLPFMILLASATSLGVNFLLIPRIGILGAAVSNIAAYFVLAAIVSWWARKSINYNFDIKYLGKVVAAALIMSAGLYFFKVEGWLIVAAIIGGIIIFGAALLILRAFSRQDKVLIKQVLGERVPWIY